MKDVLKIAITAILLVSIIFSAIWVRLGTINTRMVLDYDPWWFYRYAKMIIENNFRKPEWDYQSYYPPGRPVDNYLGWSYTIAFLSKFFNLDLVYAAKISPLIMVGLAGLASFALLYIITKDFIASLFAPLFILFSPTFLNVSMASYNDSDAPEVFYFFLSVFLTILAIEKRKPLYYFFAILGNLLFIFNWGGGWITLILFFVFIPFFIIFRIFYNFLSKGKIILDEDDKTEFSKVLIGFFPVFITTNIIGYLLGFGNMFTSFFGGLAFTALSDQLITIIIIFFAFIFGYFYLYFTKFKKYSLYIGIASSIFIFILIYSSNIPTKSLIVNISVAELQPLKIGQLITIIIFFAFIFGYFSLYFTKFKKYSLYIGIASSIFIFILIYSSNSDIRDLTNRTGLLPTFLTLFIFPIIIILNLIERKKFSYLEIFLILWAIFMLILITRGIRFNLLFAIASSVAGSFVISQLLKQVIQRKIVFILLLAFFLYISFFPIDYATRFRYFASAGLDISNDWYDMFDWLKANANKDDLVVTWWDPGHIIAGYTGLKVHADGAHCGVCYPYNHDIRIQDAGKIFHTNNENESVEIIKKYVNLTNEQCEEAKRRFPKMPSDACKPVKDVYLIASNDLIGKYFWMSCFATFDWKVWNESDGKKWACDGRNYFLLQISNIIDIDGNKYSNVIGIGEYQGNLVANVVSENGAIRTVLVKEIVYGNIISLFLKDNKTFVTIPEMDSKTNRIVRKIIEDVYIGMEKHFNFSDYPNKKEYAAFVDPSYGSIVIMDEKIKNSVFTKLFFFNGNGLKNFQLVFYRPEVRLYKVLFH